MAAVSISVCERTPTSVVAMFFDRLYLRRLETISVLFCPRSVFSSGSSLETSEREGSYRQVIRLDVFAERGFMAITPTSKSLAVGKSSSSACRVIMFNGTSTVSNSPVLMAFVKMLGLCPVMPINFVKCSFWAFLHVCRAPFEFIALVRVFSSSMPCSWSMSMWSVCKSWRLFFRSFRDSFFVREPVFVAMMHWSRTSFRACPIFSSLSPSHRAVSK